MTLLAPLLYYNSKNGIISYWSIFKTVRLLVGCFEAKFWKEHFELFVTIFSGFRKRPQTSHLAQGSTDQNRLVPDRTGPGSATLGNLELD